ncbi:MAG: MmgE/PrpD family protein [Chloroflexi bacterium]|nr:MmgE/PrpD family protein [Chloroflexota bacterium]MCL5076088.1 MmgE/PrpD family protein [Chloroflexota bacterium]
MAGLTLSQQLAAALCGLSPDNIPAAVLHAAKRVLLDALGAGLAGCSTPEVEALVRAAQSWQGNGAVTVWGRPERLAAPHAALVNGTAVHAREIDDFGGCGHSGAVVIPAVLAAAELSHPTGLDLLVAIVAGYEAAARVVDLVGGYAAHNAVGWHSTGTCGVFGAAAGASRILGLSLEQTAHALGLAGSYTGGIWSFIADGAMSKRLHAGKAAEAGIVAAYLAREGLTGPSHIFENDWGSFTSLYGGERAMPDALLCDLGKEFLILRSGFKPYACCRACHSSLDAVLQLRQLHNLSVSQIRHVVIHSSEQTARQVGKQDVKNVLDAQMSLPYSVAMALSVGRADLEHFQAPYLDDSTIRDLASRVAVVAESARPLDSQPTVEVYLIDGRVFSATVEHAKGELSNPMSDEELETKFLSLAGMRVHRERTERLQDLVWNLDRHASSAGLISLLAEQEE